MKKEFQIIGPHSSTKFQIEEDEMIEWEIIKIKDYENRDKKEEDTCCIITNSDGSPHMLVRTRVLAKQYCKKNPGYDWESFMIHEDFVI